MDYNESYYKANSQDRDRPALWMYERIWKRYIRNGPVLEFGCGMGHFARRLSRHVEMFGLEINPYALRKIRTIAPKVKALTTTADLPDGSLGSVVALHVFEHISDDDLLVIGRELNRLLRPSGRILAVMPDLDGVAHVRKGAGWSAFKDPTHVNLKGGHAWQEFFEAQWKFDVVASFADGYYDFPYDSGHVRAILSDAGRGIRTLAQFLLARPILERGDGENVIFLLEKQA